MIRISLPKNFLHFHIYIIIFIFLVKFIFTSSFSGVSRGSPSTAASSQESAG